ncbi:uncharacterized protein [Euphorbia lathyris]|uniref:uncharacterized protein n=1 Tax=Euphorbia lathyris TaxID=212925 RepID=UPI0033132710
MDAVRNMWDETDDQMDQAFLRQVTQSSAPTLRRKYVDRKCEEGAERMYKDYFIDEPVYDEHLFRGRFRMSKPLFLRIVEALGNHTVYFQQRVDAARKKGFTPLQKCTSAIRMLAYGEAADREDEYIRIAECTALECLEKFCRAIIEVFGPVYMRRPNAADVHRLFQMHEETHGFPGMLGSLDCMHWAWKNCPVGWKGQYTRGDHGIPTIMLEAVASQDLWIWHAYFGVAGSNNDLNVLNRSTLFRDKLQGVAPDEHYTMNNKTYKMGYYLTDGIYSDWAAFVKCFPHAVEPKKLTFKQKHESARKDVERAFGVLQARFSIVRGPARLWQQSKLHDIMEACIILHNMIVEDERHLYSRTYPLEVFEPSGIEDLREGPAPDFATFLARDLQLRSRVSHINLKHDLVEHIWQRFGVTDLNN